MGENVLIKELDQDSIFNNLEGHLCLRQRFFVFKVVLKCTKRQFNGVVTLYFQKSYPLSEIEDGAVPDIQIGNVTQWNKIIPAANGLYWKISVFSFETVTT